ncbi:probable DNA-3-methyladenine glycosylase [Xenia sp. Carnegie-2017]|uniref:probable DNA-3-methyladenine glycosylase n=1 Tax=Xenia sp. Carnegie-2017 TaxID=2897299 RepID=UPI001F03FB9E|nr:probable DNA-3-methyladenine glycosylase [Xenia sp. Carnegie-2017]
MAKSKSAITINKNIKSKYFKKTKNDKTTRVGKTAKIRTRSWKKQTVKSLPNPGNLGTSNSNKSILVNPLEFKRLSFDFFDSSTEKLAIDLLGKVLCRKTKQGEILCGIIVETEAYLGINDAACHSYGGRRTSRNAPMYKPPGTSYVYFIYGMYYCFNISSADEGACVLIRALEPLCGMEQMKNFRNANRKGKAKVFKDYELANGPSKLCSAFDITKNELNNIDMTTSENFWIANMKTNQLSVVKTTRIGIESYGKDAAEKKYRFYIYGNKNVSVRDKEIEANLLAIHC